MMRNKLWSSKVSDINCWQNGLMKTIKMLMNQPDINRLKLLTQRLLRQIQ
jgi:hypothetical protein